MTAGTHNTGADYVVYDVTTIVQLWADSTTPNYGFCTYDTGLNYTVQFSESTGDNQPVLCIDYDKHTAPNAITDLVAGNPDWFRVDLTWTAPSANPSAPVASYDIRYSTTSITDDASFDAATRCTGSIPTPAAPGTQQTFTVQGWRLEPPTTSPSSPPMAKAWSARSYQWPGEHHDPLDDHARPDHGSDTCNGQTQPRCSDVDSCGSRRQADDQLRRALQHLGDRNE